jgi:hypothetical protein
MGPPTIDEDKFRFAGFIILIYLTLVEEKLRIQVLEQRLR